MQHDKILAFMEEGRGYGIWDFCELLNLKESRTKDILKELADYIEPVGSNRDRRYKKVNELTITCGYKLATKIQRI